MNNTLKLACTAMLTALSVAANYATIPLNPSNSISFTIVICFIAGIYLGVLPAAVVGYFGDLIGHLISPHGAYNWYLALSTTLFGVICALVYKIKVHKLLKLTISVLICFVVCSCTLNTFGLWLQYVVGVKPGISGLIAYTQMDKSGISKSFWVYFAGRLPFIVINTAVNAVLVGVLQQSKALDKLFATLQDKMAHRKSNKTEQIAVVETDKTPENDETETREKSKENQQTEEK